jgi:hypothetical protein
VNRLPADSKLAAQVSSGPTWPGVAVLAAERIDLLLHGLGRLGIQLRGTFP